jgi:hypothetical protein
MFPTRLRATCQQQPWQVTSTRNQHPAGRYRHNAFMKSTFSDPDRLQPVILRAKVASMSFLLQSSIPLSDRSTVSISRKSWVYSASRVEIVGASRSEDFSTTYLQTSRLPPICSESRSESRPSSLLSDFSSNELLQRFASGVSIAYTEMNWCRRLASCLLPASHKLYSGGHRPMVMY